MTHADLRERVFEANREIVRAGLVVLTFGNASGVDRAAGVMAIKPSGVPYVALDPESIVLVDVETGATIDGEYRPSSDTPTHLVLYRRFAAVGGIVHTHSPHATAWAQARRAIPCLGTTHADHFHGPIPVTRPLASDEIRGEYEACTGDVIVETLERLELDPLEMPAALVASHGPFAWGAGTAQAVENAIALEAVAGMALNTVLLESAAAGIEDDLLQRHFLRKHGTGAYYGQP
ncbi:MAG TPA: L-ribulose-5-phosphate 4-epimerase AraD [Gaiellaceae bacterium]|jgi:L-ribulose-5-phosphate 4-epimerase|nr:L-ribulose-5-phosphate 4-epimerase AraD [Gaiellaceae bacterium]